MSIKEWFGARRWFLSEDTLAGLLFTGAPTLLRLLDDLVRRPRRYGREKLLPIIYLVQPTTSSSSLGGIADRYKHARVVNATVPSRPESTVRDLLEEAVGGLSSRFRRVRQIKFPHFSVAIWLLDLHGRKFSAEQPDQVYRGMVDELRNFIERRHRRVLHAGADLSDLANDLPWWIRLPSHRLPRLGIFLMRRTWSTPRWFATHPLGQRLGRGDFYRFAYEIASGNSTLTPDVLDGMLVDAFLYDLRRTYRRTTVFGVGRRRITYPLLLVANVVASSTALRLLKLIDQSRNGLPWERRGQASRRRQPRYRWDPLLIVAAGADAGLQTLRSGRIQPDMGVVPASPADSTYAYESWIRDIEQAGRNRSWILPLAAENADPPPLGARDALLMAGPRRVFPLMVTHLVIVLLLLGTLGSFRYEHGRCWTYPWEPGLHRVSHANDPDQCVGLSSGHYHFFADLTDVNDMDPSLARQLAAVEKVIYQANTRATRQSGYRTLVYLSILSSDSIVDYRVALEELRGIAVAQAENESDVPLRVLLANAGSGMEYGELAADAIAREAEHDPTLVGVLGLGISKESTRRAMLRLDAAGLPMVGTVISHVGLATKTTSYYHQVGPTNQREATLIAHYVATKLRTQKVSVYYSRDPDDIYSIDLAQQLQPALAAEHVVGTSEPYRVIPGQEGAEPGVLGQAACKLGSEGAVIYAGRSEQFPSFLAGMQRSCQGRYPHVLADDDVTRLVLDNGLRGFKDITVDYVSFASSLAWGPRCEAAVDGVPFYTRYRQMFEEACSSTRDGQAMLARDAATTFAQAIRLNHQRNIAAPSAALVLKEIDNISDRRPGGAISGASGSIDYGLADEQGVPYQKAIMLLRADANEQPSRIWLCGRLGTARPAADVRECPDK
jgi:hypothetical protein